MSCENCNTGCKPVNDGLEELSAPAMVPLSAVDGQGYRRERTLRGTIIVFCVSLVVIVLLFGAFGYYAYNLQIQSMEKIESINRIWIDYLREYDFEGYTYEYSQDGKGFNIIGDGNGVTTYGPEVASDPENEAAQGR